jgi:hypothetical protein
MLPIKSLETMIDTRSGCADVCLDRPVRFPDQASDGDRQAKQHGHHEAQYQERKKAHASPFSRKLHLFRSKLKMASSTAGKMPDASIQRDEDGV